MLVKVDLVPSQFHITAEWFLHPGEKLAKTRLLTQELLMECPKHGRNFSCEICNRQHTVAAVRVAGLTLSFTRRVHWGGWGKWAVVLWTINLKEESGLTLGRYCFHRMVPELLSMPKSCKKNKY